MTHHVATGRMINSIPEEQDYLDTTNARAVAIVGTPQPPSEADETSEVVTEGGSNNMIPTTSTLPGAVAVTNSDSCSIDPKASKKTGSDDKKRRRLPASSSTGGNRRWGVLGHWNSRISRAENASCDDILIMDDDHDRKIIEASTTKPPAFRYIDMTPPNDTDVLPSNVVVVADETASVVTGVTTNSAVTAPANNAAATFTNRNVRSEQTTVTSSTSVVTFEVQNSSAINHRHASVRPHLEAVRRNNEMPFNDEEKDSHQAEACGRWCHVCGSVKTHEKESYGPFGIFTRMQPQTVKGRVYEGYCLCCHDVYALRQLLSDPSISFSLIRYDASIHTSVRLLQGSDLLRAHRDDSFPVATARVPRSPREVICASFYCQVACALVVLAIIGACIGVSVVLSKSPDPWVSPPPTIPPSMSPSTLLPTSAPTSFEDNLLMTIWKDDIESFGYNVELARFDDILVVASPKYDDSRGRLDVFNVVGREWKSVGDPIIGELVGDQLGLGMQLSGDGKVVAVGLPGNSAGLVQVYAIDSVTGLSQKGQAIKGSAQQSQFGYSVSLDYAGLRLFIGAPQFGYSTSEVYGLVQVYDYDGSAWVKVGKDIIGENLNSRFGHSIATGDSGNRVAIGAPLDSDVGVGAGRVLLFGWEDDNWKEVDTGWLLHGSQAGSQLGTQVAMGCESTHFATGDHHGALETYANAGQLKIWVLEYSAFIPNLVVDPISGSYEGAHFGHGLKLDCTPINLQFVAIASSENRYGRAGSTRLEVINPLQQHQGTEFFRPQLGDAQWLGKGPSVAISGYNNRVAIGYESVMHDDVSRSEVRIYHYQGFKK